MEHPHEPNAQRVIAYAESLVRRPPAPQATAVQSSAYLWRSGGRLSAYPRASGLSDYGVFGKVLSGLIVVACVPGWIVLAVLSIPFMFWPVVIAVIADVLLAVLNQFRSGGEDYTGRLFSWYFLLLFSVPAALVGYGILIVVGGFIGLIVFSLMSTFGH